ncbi:MAG: hypothetical protein KF778_10700 [Rhodocyclaceae bacterium]|nr:hypothetical protein [Rhodocyclaceae bacterium]MBX3668861.1 hypothetical protein [Rhodocyclaceae bacterium]
MKYCISIFLLAAAFGAGAADVTPPVAGAFGGPDFSGVYDCTGQDQHEGAYSGTVTLQIVRAHSQQKYGAYMFKLEAPGFGAYVGEGVAQGTTMAVRFALDDAGSKDYGTGIANFTRAKNGRWSFRKYYFEPEYKGGNHGFEDCAQR